MTETTHSTTRRFPHRTRALWAVLVTAALVIAGFALTVGSTDRTSAAWTRDVHAVTSVRLASWATAPMSCTPVGPGSTVAGTCEIERAEVSVSGDPGSREMVISGKILGSFDPPVFPRLVVDLSELPNVPADWDWATTAPVDIRHVDRVDCSAPPIVIADLSTQSWNGKGTIELLEGQSTGLCLAPVSA